MARDEPTRFVKVVCLLERGCLRLRVARQRSPWSKLLHGHAQCIGKLLEHIESLDGLHSPFDLRHPAGCPLHEDGQLLLGQAALLAEPLNMLTEGSVFRGYLLPRGLHGASSGAGRFPACSLRNVTSVELRYCSRSRSIARVWD
ncbi:hypothetical protein GCM10010103_65960 [Streptomyces paradoxus]